MVHSPVVFQSRVLAEFAKVSVYFLKELQLTVGQTAEKYCNDFMHKQYSIVKYIVLNRQTSTYHKVGSSRPVYYSILNSLGHRSQFISIKFPLYKQSENP